MHNVNTGAIGRSLRFWSSVKAGRVTSAIFPLTAYNALTGASIYAGSLRAHNPERAVLLGLTINLMLEWQREMDAFNVQQLRWALTNFPAESQADILNYFATPKERMKTDAKHSLPPDIIARLEMSLAALDQALLTKDSMMPQHLKQSHQLLITYPETVHLLDDEEIARLISAAQIHTGIEIVKMSTPKAGGRKKASADDL
jgi:hypothetical protein